MRRHQFSQTDRRRTRFEWGIISPKDKVKTEVKTEESGQTTEHYDKCVNEEQDCSSNTIITETLLDQSIREIFRNFMIALMVLWLDRLFNRVIFI